MLHSLLDPNRLRQEVEVVAAGRYLADPGRLIAKSSQLFQVPELMSSLECAAKHRILPGTEDGATVRYDPMRTPYNIGPHNALDNDQCQLMVMVKPSRSGGTTVCENYAFKLMGFGPMAHISWILNSDEASGDYCRNVVKPMFEHNEVLQRNVGTDRGDDTDQFKRVRGYPIEYLSAKDSTFRNRQPFFMVEDETDAFPKRYAASPRVQIDGRQKLLGNRRKAAILSHADLGYVSGVAAAFDQTSRGIYIGKCPECSKHATFFATKYWDDVPQFLLKWSRNDQLSNDERVELAQKTAHLECPHCKAKLDDEQRKAMVDEAVTREDDSYDGWMHRGQTLDEDEGVVGLIKTTKHYGFWVHGTMLKTESMSELAGKYQAAKNKWEDTKDPSELREFMSKQLGEIYEGAATMGGVSSRSLKQRVLGASYERGTVPPAVKFITASVDPGKKQLDVMFIGWDLKGRSFLLDRLTIRQKQDEDGRWRDLDLYGQVKDFDVILDQVVDRRFPWQHDPHVSIPVAVTVVDASDNTDKVREFARNALTNGVTWNGWSKIKLIKGMPGKKPVLPDAPRKVDKDELGKVMLPLLEYNLGVDRLKEQTLERLSTPRRDEKTGDLNSGYVAFYRDFEANYIDQFFGETLVDGKWVRHRPNESLDLFGYCEAGRLMLEPDRKSIKWKDVNLRPIWARPTNDLAQSGPDQPPSNPFDDFGGLSQG